MERVAEEFPRSSSFHRRLIRLSHVLSSFSPPLPPPNSPQTSTSQKRPSPNQQTSRSEGSFRSGTYRSNGVDHVRFPPSGKVDCRHFNSEISTKNQMRRIECNLCAFSESLFAFVWRCNIVSSILIVVRSGNFVLYYRELKLRLIE